ncbi:MAG: Holliday junction resolvase RuvX [Desulfovibrio sp.]|nr:Holliday junction resolvase RuvX [Desulfovibrio sp.]
MTKFLGIDYGLERTGLAAADDGGGPAFPLAVLSLKNYPNRDALIDALAEIAAKEKAEAIVIGLPLDEDGGETERSVIARNFAKRLKSRVDLPFYLVSEYLSSFEAWNELASSGVKFRKRKKVLDQAAAMKILEYFFEIPEDERTPL